MKVCKDVVREILFVGKIFHKYGTDFSVVIHNVMDDRREDSFRNNFVKIKTNVQRLILERFGVILVLKTRF